MLKKTYISTSISHFVSHSLTSITQLLTVYLANPRMNLTTSLKGRLAAARDDIEKVKHLQENLRALRWHLEGLRKASSTLVPPAVPIHSADGPGYSLSDVLQDWSDAYNAMRSAWTASVDAWNASALAWNASVEAARSSF